MNIPELLAPAGNEKALHAGISAGADAVYLGLDQFNARRNAENFTLEHVERACDYAHLRGARVYVTMNTIILPDELDAALECARQAYVRGIDALIVQDIGLASLVSRCLPDLRLHISTQMNIHSVYGIEAAAALGAKRVTLARELSLPEIEQLSHAAHEFGIEVETFGHGALCVCYSGQCFMSSMIGGRSANRGLCAQACRLPYTLIDSLDPDRELKSPGEFLLSPKDLCSVDLLGQLAQANVDSLKVEGRMKSPEYVSSVVSVYREMLDRLANLNESAEGEGEQGSHVRSVSNTRATEAQRERLASVFSRGFSTAYLTGERGNDMMSYQRPNNRGQFVGRIKTIRDNVAHVSSDVLLEPGDLLEFWTRRGNAVFELPSSFEAGRKTIYIPLDDLDVKIQKNDRVFRVRSASAQFSDDDREPRIPVVGHAVLKKDEPLRIVFRVARPEEVQTSDTLHAKSLSLCIAKRLASFLQTISFPFEAEASGVTIEAARSKAIAAQEVIEHVDRMGSTPFELCHLEVEVEEGVGLGYSQIHRCRSEALENLQDVLLAPHKDRKRTKSKSVHRETPTRRKADVEVAVLATNPDCARAAKRAGAHDIYVPALNYKYAQAQTAGSLDKNPRQAGYPKNCKLIMPTIDHDIVAMDADNMGNPVAEAETLQSCESHHVSFGKTNNTMNGEARVGIDVWELVHPQDVVVAESLSSLHHALSVGASPEIGPHLPVVNTAALDVVRAMDAQRVWLSPELNIHQIKEIIGKTDLEFGITVFGAQELMATEHCLLMSEASCSQQCAECARRKKPHVLRDRKGYEFPVVTDSMGRSHLYNSVKLDLMGALEELLGAGVSTFMIDATLLDPEQTAQATGRLIHALKQVKSGKGNIDKLPHTTTGHLFRGVL